MLTHIAAITQIRHRRLRAVPYYERTLADGKTTKEAIRALSDVSATRATTAQRVVDGRALQDAPAVVRYAG